MHCFVFISLEDGKNCAFIFVLDFAFAFQITEQVKNVLHKIPVGLQEPVTRLVNPDTRKRPSTQLLSLIQYFR